MKLDVDGNYKIAAYPAFFAYKASGQIFSLTPCFVNLSPRNF